MLKRTEFSKKSVMTKQLVKDLISSVGTNRISKDFWKSNQEELEMINATLECAERDFAASSLLWKNGDRPNAIYHLQQGVEKLAKAQGKHGLYQHSKDFFREVGHDSPTVYLTTLKKKVPRQLLQEFKKYEPRLDITPIEEIENQIKLLRKDHSARKDIATMSAYDIGSLLKIADTVMNLDDKKMIYRALEENLGKKWKKEIKEYVEDIVEKQQGKEVTVTESAIMDVIEKDHTAIAAMFQLGMPLYVLAVITFPHEAFTRYPDRKEIVPSDYKAPLGIVVMYDKLIDLGFNLLEKLQTMIKFLN